MENPHDTIINLDIPAEHELAQYKNPMVNSVKPSHNPGEFRTLAAEQLRKQFEGICWTLRESRTNSSIELKVAVKTEYLEEFRKKVATLGFREFTPTKPRALIEGSDRNGSER